MKSGVYLVTQSEVKEGKKNMPFIRYWNGKNWYRCDLDGKPWGSPDCYGRKSLIVLREKDWLLGGNVVALPKQKVLGWRDMIKSIFRWLN